MTLLGDRLRNLRHQQGWTVRESADRASCTPGFISRIEAREDFPSPELLCRLADLYGVSAEELLSLLKKVHLARLEREIDEKHQVALRERICARSAG